MTIFQYILSDENLGSALISGFVSLLIAGVSGAYVLFLTKRKLSYFRNELLEEVRVKRFADTSTPFLESYKSYKRELGEIKDNNQKAGNAADGTMILQHVLNFFGEVKIFYTENKSILGEDKIDDKIKQVQSIIDSGVLNDHSSEERMGKINVVFEKSASVIEEIYKAALR